MIHRATQMARLNPVAGLPKMAAILLANKRLFLGYNSRKTHPLAKKFGKNSDAVCLHAEIDAIRTCTAQGVSPEGGTMWVARVLKNGQPALAKPCPGCQAALVAFGIKEVHWTE